MTRRYVARVLELRALPAKDAPGRRRRNRADRNYLGQPQAVAGDMWPHVDCGRARAVAERQVA